MRNRESFNTAVCPDYETLLKQCQAALEIWEQRRDEVCRARLAGTEQGGDLLGLQAEFAAKYALLRQHVDECQLCQFERMRLRRHFARRIARSSTSMTGV